MEPAGLPNLDSNRPMILTCRGLLFDSDGVLVDSDASVISAWSRWAERYDLDPVRVVEMVHGRRSADTVAALLPHSAVARALAEIDQYEIEDAAQVTALPGAVELLSGLPPGQWAVVTSAVKSLAVARLSAAGIPTPPVLITADMVANGKPHPQGYQSAARYLGLKPADCVVFEDAPSGIEAAISAGVFGVVGIGSRSIGLPVDISIPNLQFAQYSTGMLTLS